MPLAPYPSLFSCGLGRRDNPLSLALAFVALYDGALRGNRVVLLARRAIRAAYWLPHANMLRDEGAVELLDGWRRRSGIGHQAQLRDWTGVCERRSRRRHFLRFRAALIAPLRPFRLDPRVTTRHL